MHKVTEHATLKCGPTIDRMVALEIGEVRGDYVKITINLDDAERLAKEIAKVVEALRSMVEQND